LVKITTRASQPTAVRPSQYFGKKYPKNIATATIASGNKYSDKIIDIRLLNIKDISRDFYGLFNTNALV